MHGFSSSAGSSVVHLDFECSLATKGDQLANFPLARLPAEVPHWWFDVL
jgi:hypothetical protein